MRQRHRASVTVLGGETYYHPVGFPPELWSVHLVSPISHALKVFERLSDVGGDNYWPLSGTGHVDVSGNGTDDRIAIENPSEDPTDIIIYAVVGLRLPIYTNVQSFLPAAQSA